VTTAPWPKPHGYPPARWEGPDLWRLLTAGPKAPVYLGGPSNVPRETHNDSLMSSSAADNPDTTTDADTERDVDDAQQTP
jgi:hypothetical protein